MLKLIITLKPISEHSCYYKKTLKTLQIELENWIIKRSVF